MLRMERKKQVGLTLIAVALLAACTNYREPAQAALTQAESAIQGIAADAQKYVPAEFQGLQDKLATAKASFDKGEHKKALEAAQTLASEVDRVATAATTKK